MTLPTGDVGEASLGDAVEHRVGVLAEIRDASAELSVHHGSGGGELGSEGFQGWSGRVRRARRAKPAGDAADLVEAVAGGLLDLVQVVAHG
jgi:hypothetical protein